MQLTTSPESEAQKEKMEQLQREFLQLYTERDRMINEERDDLYIRYVNLIGKDKYENFKLSVEVRALKMKLELVQAAINRNCRPDLNDIQRNVDAQLEDYYEKVRLQADAIKEVQDAITISQLEAEELRQLYHMLVKRLHPDLHPDQTEKMKELFLQGQTAYRTHNIPLLREIMMRIDMDGDVDDLLSHTETIGQIMERLEKQIADIRREIDLLNESFPFTLRDLLPNSAWIQEQQEELGHEREQLEAQKKMYEERFMLTIEWMKTLNGNNLTT